MVTALVLVVGVAGPAGSVAAQTSPAPPPPESTTVTSDGAPLVGRLVGDSNVWHAIGLGPYGLAWAPIAADKIAGLVLAR